MAGANASRFSVPPQRKRGNDGRPRFSSLFTTSAAGSRTDRCQGCPGFRSRHTSGSPVALSPWAGPSSAFLIDGPFIWGSICNLLTQDVSLFLPPARRLHQPHPATGTLSEPVDEGFAFQDHAGQRETGCASSPSRNLMVLSSDTLDTPSLWLLLAGCCPCQSKPLGVTAPTHDSLVSYVPHRGPVQ